jgi:hypothetical protein
VFTTNFDDLINEAFHQFSDTRPIVCAHDSSILSVTFTSRRPKIIKLHGDYLFDDIKSTLRETETLEKNTRDKFIELSREIGLIVVGYSGSDRSVMETIDFLIKDESYLKNGVYWCLRGDDYISEEVIKLLWKDRVFWIDIEGFDQCFAQLHSNLMGPELPINTGLFNQQHLKIYDRYLNNDALRASTCTVIQDHLSRIAKEKNSDEIASEFKAFAFPTDEVNKSSESEDWTYEDYQINFHIQKLAKTKNFQGVIEYALGRLAYVSDPDRRIRLLTNAYGAAKTVNDVAKATEIADRLIDEAPKMSKYYRFKASVVDDLDEKLEIISQAIRVNPFTPINYVRKGRFLLSKGEASSSTERDALHDEVSGCIDTALRVSPSLSNPAWNLKFDFAIDYRRDKKQDADLLVAIDRLEEQSPYSPELMDLKLSFCKYKNTRDLKGEDIIDSIDNARASYYSDPNVEGTIVLIDALQHFDEKDRLRGLLLECDEIPKYSQHSRFIRAKSLAIAEVLADIPRAIKTVQEYSKFENDDDLVALLIDFLADVGRIEDAEKMLNTFSYMFEHNKLQDKFIMINDYKDDLSAAFDALARKRSNKYTEREIAMDHSYLYLRSGEFKRAKDVAHNFLKAVNFDVRHEVLILNYEFACQKTGGNIHKPRLSSLLSASRSRRSRAVANVLLGNRGEALAMFREFLSNQYTESVNVLRWPILESMRGDLHRIIDDLKPGAARTSDSNGSDLSKVPESGEIALSA